MLAIKDLQKNYGKNQVLKNITWKADRGQTIALIGPNASGKTTLVKCILGMALPTSGSIFFDGQEIDRSILYRNQISYLPQIARFPDNLTGSEVLSMVKTMRGGPSHEENLVQYFGLENETDKRMKDLSGGTRQKFNLVLALMFDSDLIILDEPSNGLDPLTLIRLKDLLKTLKEKGKTLIITTHIMSFVEELADEVVFLLEGKIHYSGSLRDLLATQNEIHLENAIAHILTQKHV